MPELKDVDNFDEAVSHTLAVFATAEETLRKVHVDGLEAAGLSDVEYGSYKLKRLGKKRQVHYVEAEDGSGPRLRIEIYIIEAAPPLEVFSASELDIVD